MKIRSAQRADLSFFSETKYSENSKLILVDNYYDFK